MYATCLFCQRPLGANDVIEAFPVGRRLAFDAAKGRLWVVCTACGRWNLTPVEERWDAIERCEAEYRAVRLRVSTENVGLAHLREGLELVRIGSPLRPEFAAWRYTGQFLDRHRRSSRRRALGAVAHAGVASAVGLGTMVSGIGAFYAARWAEARIERWWLERPVARVAAADGAKLVVRRRHLMHVDIVPADDPAAPLAWALRLRHDDGETVFTGQRGIRTLGALLSRINAAGAPPLRVEQAVAAIERAGDPEEYLGLIARVGLDHAQSDGSKSVPHFSISTRLALEMAAHEDAERLALAGELAELELAWREAEEIAAIADDLFLPDFVSSRAPVRPAEPMERPGA